MTELIDPIKRPKFPAAKPKNTCHVCGDVASHFNFNVITCEPCKSFFRRNFDKRKVLACSFDGKCTINVTTRRFCSACRLKKCFDVGMIMETPSSSTATTRETTPEKDLQALLQASPLVNIEKSLQTMLKPKFLVKQKGHQTYPMSSYQAQSSVPVPPPVNVLPEVQSLNPLQNTKTFNMLATVDSIPTKTASMPTKTAVTLESSTMNTGQDLLNSLPETSTSTMVSSSKVEKEKENKEKDQEPAKEKEDATKLPFSEDDENKNYVKVPVKFLKFLIGQKPDIGKYVQENTRKHHKSESGEHSHSHKLNGRIRKKCRCRCSCGMYSKKWLIVDKVMTDFLNFSAKQGNPPIEDLVTPSEK